MALSNSRGPETLQAVVEELGPHARAMTAAEAAWFGEVVVVSLPFGRYLEVPTEGVAGKVVIDTNNYYPDRDGHFEELDSDRTTSTGIPISGDDEAAKGTVAELIDEIGLDAVDAGTLAAGGRKHQPGNPNTKDLHTDALRARLAA